MCGAVCVEEVAEGAGGEEGADSTRGRLGARRAWERCFAPVAPVLTRARDTPHTCVTDAAGNENAARVARYSSLGAARDRESLRRICRSPTAADAGAARSASVEGRVFAAGYVETGEFPRTQSCSARAAFALGSCMARVDNGVLVRARAQRASVGAEDAAHTARVARLEGCAAIAS